VLTPDYRTPVLRGTSVDEVDYVCGECGELIAEGVIEDQLFDFRVVCAACGALVQFPQLPAGRPLPWQKTVMLNYGRYRLSETVDIREDVVVAGEDAVQRRLREVGGIGASESASRTLDEQLLRGMASDAQDLLDESFEKLASSHARGKQSQTPPVNPHRLLALIDAAETAADSFAAGDPEIDPVAIAELDTALTAFDRWRRDPSWASIVASVTNPTEFLHAVVMLVAASYLTDARNGVELVRATGGKRLPDLRIYIDPRTVVSTEVKTPGALIRPEKLLSLDQAREIVRNQVSSAGTSAGGQLDPAHPGLLIIGGFGLRDPDLDVLRNAAREELQRTARRRAHVLGIAVVSIGTRLDVDSKGFGPTYSLSGTARTEIILNQAFKGTIAVDTSDQPSLRRLQGGLELLDPDQPTPRKIGRNEPCWCGSGQKFKRCHGA
jgi:SEC-C motif